MRRRHEESEWATPCFLIPKNENGTVWFLTDLRKVNKKVKRKSYLLPNISDILQTLHDMKYTPGASNLCAVVTEFGTYECMYLPMGISCALDIFQ